jgi:thiol-disulfide isomerase/thioredoxin
MTAALPRVARRRVLLAGFAALSLLLVSGAGSHLGAQPAWELRGLDGGSLGSGDVGSGATVMVVWAGWSPRCRDIVERTNDIASRYGRRARVVMVDFQEEAGEVSAFLDGKGARARVYLDGDGSFAKQHRVTTLPGLVVYVDGGVVYQGKLPDDPDSVLADALP